MPPSRYVFADLDVLQEDVHTHIKRNYKAFSSNVMGGNFPLNALKLTEFLSRPDGEIKFYRGTYYHLKAMDVGKFQDAGWDLRPKSFPEHHTLENLLKRNLANGDNGYLANGTKTLVLVGGSPSMAVYHRVIMYLEAGWRVQLYCFREKGSEGAARLRLQYPTLFQSVYIGGSIRNMLKRDIHLAYGGSEIDDIGGVNANHESRLQQLEAAYIALRTELKADHVRLQKELASKSQQLQYALMNELHDYRRTADANYRASKIEPQWHTAPNEAHAQTKKSDADEGHLFWVIMVMMLAVLFIVSE